MHRHGLHIAEIGRKAGSTFLLPDAGYNLRRGKFCPKTKRKRLSGIKKERASGQPSQPRTRFIIIRQRVVVVEFFPRSVRPLFWLIENAKAAAKSVFLRSHTKRPLFRTSSRETNEATRACILLLWAFDNGTNTSKEGRKWASFQNGPTDWWPFPEPIHNCLSPECKFNFAAFQISRIKAIFFLWKRLKRREKGGGNWHKQRRKLSMAWLTNCQSVSIAHIMTLYAKGPSLHGPLNLQANKRTLY